MNTQTMAPPCADRLAPDDMNHPHKLWLKDVGAEQGAKNLQARSAFLAARPDLPERELRAALQLSEPLQYTLISFLYYPQGGELLNTTEALRRVQAMAVPRPWGDS